VIVEVREIAVATTQLASAETLYGNLPLPASYLQIPDGGLGASRPRQVPRKEE